MPQIGLVHILVKPSKKTAGQCAPAAEITVESARRVIRSRVSALPSYLESDGFGRKTAPTFFWSTRSSWSKCRCGANGTKSGRIEDHDMTEVGAGSGRVEHGFRARISRSVRYRPGWRPFSGCVNILPYDRRSLVATDISHALGIKPHRNQHPRYAIVQIPTNCDACPLGAQRRIDGNLPGVMETAYWRSRGRRRSIHLDSWHNSPHRPVEFLQRFHSASRAATSRWTITYC